MLNQRTLRRIAAASNSTDQALGRKTGMKQNPLAGTILSWMQKAVFNCARGIRTSYLRWSSLVAPRFALRDGLRRKEGSFSFLPSTYPSARKRASGTCWANLWSRLRRFIFVAMTVSLTLYGSSRALTLLLWKFLRALRR